LTEPGLVEVENHGRERHFGLRAEPLEQVRQFIAHVAQEAFPSPVTPQALDALATEVRRTARERQRAKTSRTTAREAIA
jgi:hypothetical protein